MKRFVGGLLLAIGILIAGLSGLCSLFVLAMTATSGSDADLNGIMAMLSMVLPIGGVPFALGVGCIIGGRALLKKP
jgi:hypothetical protein